MNDECANPYHHSHGIYIPCGVCFFCRETGTRGMSITHPAPKKPKQKLSRNQMQAMSPLSPQYQGRMRDKHLVGIPERYHGAILDADLLRRRSYEIRGKGREKIIRQLLQVLASKREAEREPAGAALFWCFRAWFNIWQTAPARPDMEPRSQSPDSRTLHRAFTPHSTSYKALETWAYRCMPPQFEISEICREICNEVQRTGPGPARNFSFPSPQTRSWLQWFSHSSGIALPIPDTQMGTRAFHRDRWEEMGLIPEDAWLLGMALQPFGHSPQSREFGPQSGMG